MFDRTKMKVKRCSLGGLIVVDLVASALQAPQTVRTNLESSNTAPRERYSSLGDSKQGPAPGESHAPTG
jgi:hypothetical protein